MAARMPMIAMTISSSISVKPDSRFFMCPSYPSSDGGGVSSGMR
jgi:hypothetical protein